MGLRPGEAEESTEGEDDDVIEVAALIRMRLLVEVEEEEDEWCINNNRSIWIAFLLSATLV